MLGRISLWQCTGQTRLAVRPRRSRCDPQHSSPQDDDDGGGSGTTLAGSGQEQAEQNLADAFNHALKLFKAPDWAEFTRVTSATMMKPGNWPAFYIGVASGVVDYLKAEFEAYVEIGKGLGSWLAGVASCTWERITSGLPADKIEQCRPIQETIASAEAIANEAKLLYTLEKAALLELAQEFFALVVEALSAALVEGLVELGEQADGLKKWLGETAKNAEKLGKLAGTLTGAILLEFATAGVGRAIKAARFVRAMPETSGLARALRPADLSVAPSDPARTAAVARMGAFSPASFQPSGSDPFLGALFNIFFKAFRKHKIRFSKNLTIKKLRIISNHFKDEHRKSFLAMRMRSELLVVGELRHRWGQVRRHGDNVAVAERLNVEVLTFHYADALAHLPEGEIPDDFEILFRKDAIRPYILESNHIFEGRIFEKLQTNPLWQSTFKCLGWGSVRDMESVLMTSAAHTGSVERMLRRYGLSDAKIKEVLPDADIGDVPPEPLLTDLPKNLTETLLNLIVFEDKPRALQPDRHNIERLVVGPNTPPSKVFEKYAEIYSKHEPDLWDKSLKSTFGGWKVKKCY